LAIDTHNFPPRPAVSVVTRRPILWKNVKTAH
jgi:hypothetical protein